ncbi:MAG: DUF1573 domain-containing protein [Rikenellaceae bacterium]|nr:DUF1573 domain-containing protein [Rikenellaceae bacterium]MCL2692664.1 DUF1573 domain-containing protein [Rikenellaceae bacterium]
MKKAVLLLSFVMITAAVGAKINNQPVERRAEIEFAQTEHNFGVLAERGGRVSHTFRFTNTSDRPIVIKRVVVTCRCVSYDFSKRPVAPGDTGEITITFNPRRQSGVFYKVVQVFASTAEELHLLIVRGEVSR